MVFQVCPVISNMFCNLNTPPARFDAFTCCMSMYLHLTTKTESDIIQNMKSIISSSHKTTVSIKSNDLSSRERLKLAGFSWDRSSKTWYITNNLEIYNAVRKAVYASQRLLEIPGIYVSSPVSKFVLSRWTSAGPCSSGQVWDWKKLRKRSLAKML